MINGAIMNIKQLSLAAAVSVLTFSTVTNAILGPIPIYLNPIDVGANYFNGLDTNATFASEVYTSEDIKDSNASNLYDFLNQNTSISISPNSGDRFTQKIDMRGFGLTNGFENIIIVLNGRRLNNIDSVAASLSTLSIANIGKIEIAKGSGSVVYGDGAMAGVIHIYTKKSNDSTLQVSIGNHGIQQASLSVNAVQDNLSLSTSFNNYKQDGFSISDDNGHKDEGLQDNKSFEANYDINEKTEITLGFQDNKIDNRYPNWLTLSEFNADPSQNPIDFTNYRYGLYTHIVNNSEITNFDIKHKINENIKISLNTSHETKDITTFSRNDYDYKIKDILFAYQKDNIEVKGGRTSFEGRRIAVDNTTTKNNTGLFLQGNYKLNDDTYTLGFRDEDVDYKYNPNSDSGTPPRSEKLKAFNIGFNKKINDKTSIFSNYNHAFQTPSIDNFFASNYDNWPIVTTDFNGFIDPAKIKTFNIGINHITKNRKTKATVFRSNLENEIYLNKHTGEYINTNIDKSHKYGLEIQHAQQVNSKLSTNINYAYTRAIIDSDSLVYWGSDALNSIYDGNDLPMVSKHSITASADYKINSKSKINLTHKYRSDAYAEEDFTNIGTQKQKAFNSTDVNFLYQYDKDIDLTLHVENLFLNKHGSWLRDDVIYPANFTRNIKAGLIYRF
jgi:iron complex outermembrane receptor protein